MYINFFRLKRRGKLTFFSFNVKVKPNSGLFVVHATPLHELEDDADNGDNSNQKLEMKTFGKSCSEEYRGMYNMIL